MRLSLIFLQELHCGRDLLPAALQFPLNRRLGIPFAGGHREAVIPVPIPNTEVKGLFAEGTAGLARGRVGRRRLSSFYSLATKNT